MPRETLAMAHEVSEGDKACISAAEDHLTFGPRIWFLFYQCPENLGEIELETNEPICLAENISRQASSQAGAEKAAVTEASITEEQPSARHWDNKKGVLRTDLTHPREVPS